MFWALKLQMKFGLICKTDMLQYLSRLRNIKDQLIDAGEVFSDNDFIVAVLSGLPRKYHVIRTVIFTRDTTMSLRESREQLLCAEREAESH